MMRRRRSLMHISLGSSGGSEGATYTTNQISQQQLTSGPTAASSVMWYYAADFTFDPVTGLFTLVDPSTMVISYSSARLARTKVILGNYCIPGSAEGKTMYLFPSSGTFSVARGDGVYTSTLSGNITEYVSSAA